VLAEIIQSTGFLPYYLVRRAGTENDEDSSTNSVNSDIRASLRFHVENTYPTPIVWNEETHNSETHRVVGQAVIKRRRTIESVESAARTNPSA
jgi:hypothetical protein